MRFAALGNGENCSGERGSKIAFFPLKTRSTVDLRDFEVAKFRRTMRELINAEETRDRSIGRNRASVPKKGFIISGGSLGATINMSTASKARFAVSKISIKILTNSTSAMKESIHAKEGINGRGWW
jgi:hypothetical protein